MHKTDGDSFAMVVALQHLPWGPNEVTIVVVEEYS